MTDVAGDDALVYDARHQRRQIQFRQRLEQDECDDEPHVGPVRFQKPQQLAQPQRPLSEQTRAPRLLFPFGIASTCFPSCTD